MTEATDKRVELGRVSGVFGIKGWVKVHSETRPREEIGEYGVWWLQSGGEWQAFEVEASRLQGSTVVAKLEGVDDRNAAEALKGCRISVREEDLPDLEPGEFYWRDLVGLKVVTLEGDDLGKVDRLMETGANDVLVVKGERERLIPFTPGIAIQDVDIQAGVIKVDWDPGF